MPMNRAASAAAFHPAVEAWFRKTFAGPDRGAGARLAGDPGRPPRADRGADRLGQDARRVPRRDRRPGAARASNVPLPDETVVVYVSPLKALSNDIQRNLEAPLAGIRAELAALGLPDVEIRTLVRTGDTPQSERASMRKRRRTSSSRRRSRCTSCSAPTRAARCSRRRAP